MRLFLAVQLDDPTKDLLCRVRDGLAERCVKGRFTRRENFHLTLVFLGETDRFSDAAQVVEETAQETEPFQLKLGGGTPEPLGRFRRERGGDIYWVGVELCPPLERLVGDLSERLRVKGFELEQRPYRPHLTLGRQVRAGDGFEAAELARTVPEMELAVRRISLMESAQQDGVLTYTERCGRGLEVAGWE